MTTSSEALSSWGMAPAGSVEIFPLEAPLKASLALPGSKSFTNRALILAAVAEGASTLRSPLFSDDSYWCVNALSRLGVQAQADRNSDVITLEGIGQGSFAIKNPEDLPYIGSAGTIARFLPGVVAARGRGEITLTSSSQLARRPVAEVVNAFRQLGADIRMTEGASFPMTVMGGSLTGGEATISGKTSSQFISGLLIAAPFAKKPVTIRISDSIVQADYVRITLDMMKEFGVSVDHAEDLKEFRIVPQSYKSRDISLEADASTATYFFALAAATRSEITITNLNPDTVQPDFAFLKYLEMLGCAVRQAGRHVSVIGPDILKGGQSFDFNACSDSTPALASIAPFADGPLRVHNVAHIRAHESDRLAVLRKNLAAAGVTVEEFADGLAITPTPGAPVYATIDPHDDHRMAMALGVMAAAGRGGKILNPACVSKTCPDFFGLLKKAGVKCSIQH